MSRRSLEICAMRALCVFVIVSAKAKKVVHQISGIIGYLLLGIWRRIAMLDPEKGCRQNDAYCVNIYFNFK